MYRQFNIQQLYVYLCVLCGSQYKERLLPYTLTYRFYNRDGSVYCAVRTGSLNQTDTLTFLKCHPRQETHQSEQHSDWSTPRRLTHNNGSLHVQSSMRFSRNTSERLLFCAQMKSTAFLPNAGLHEIHANVRQHDA
jgi:hypothetical protein